MSLTRTQSLRLAAVLEDCSDQLDILGHTLTVQISSERGSTAAQEIARLTKLRRDCQFISQYVSKLHMELEETQHISSLQQMLEEEEQKKKAESMRREAKRELEQRKLVVYRQQEDVQQKRDKLNEMDWLARDLKHQLVQQSSEIANKKLIAKKNIELQLQRTQKEASRAEELLEEQLELLQKKLQVETRVHEESEKFLQTQHKELQQQWQRWQQRTEQMLQEKEQQLGHVCRQRTANLEILSERRMKFREMEQVVVEDREEQEKLRQQQEEATAATKLQAWWRGCMVRRGLGSFKKAEDYKKGKKKEGKKKKKKKK